MVSFNALSYYKEYLKIVVIG